MACITLAKSPWDTRKNMRKIGHLWKMPCVSLLLCLYHTVLVTALPPPTPSNIESACNDSGCEEPFKSTLHWGWRGDARICGVFAKVSQDFWPGLSENPPFNKTLDNVAKLEYILPILEEITLRLVLSGLQCYRWLHGTAFAEMSWQDRPACLYRDVTVLRLSYSHRRSCDRSTLSPACILCCRSIDNSGQCFQLQNSWLNKILSGIFEKYRETWAVR